MYRRENPTGGYRQGFKKDLANEENFTFISTILQEGGLTSPVCFGNAGLPQNRVRRNRRLYLSPQFGKKCGLSCFVSKPATGASCGWCYILAGQRPVSVRTGGLTRAGERCPAFFCTQPPKPCRFPMLRFFLSSRYLRLRHLVPFLIVLTNAGGKHE